jgi:hypothetical protein
MWSLVELLADGLLCFVAILVASTRLPAGPIDSDLAFPEILRTAAAFTVAHGAPLRVGRSLPPGSDLHRHPRPVRVGVWRPSVLAPSSPTR